MSALQTDILLKARATEKLTFTYLQKLEHQKYRALALLLFLSALSFIWLLFQFDNGPGQDGPALFSNVMYTLTSLIGAYWIFRVVYQAGRGPIVLGKRYRLAWMLIGLGLIANGLGNVYYGYYQYMFRLEPPTPSYADISFTLSYALSLSGLLLLPRETRTERPAIYIVIDILIATVCLFGISWYVIINPMIIQYQPDALLLTIMTISYPCWDILLVLVLILFVHQRATPVLRPSLWICSLGVLALVWGDLGYAYISSYGHYQSGMAGIDPFWFLGYLLIGIASLYQQSAIARQLYANNTLVAKTTTPSRIGLAFERRFVLLQSFMIYIPFLTLLSITLYSQFTTDINAMHLLDALCAIVFVLVITHYSMATYHNAWLVHEKEQSRVEADLLRRSTASLSCVLEMDLLLNHIVAIGATELGFDAAALVLIDEFDRSVDEQSNLLARAATSEGTPIMSWLVAGQKISSCLALLGKVNEILWSEAPAHIPTVVHQWHKDQHIQASLFAPLAYQGKIQGSLAFSINISRRFTSHEYYLANAFAEEAARAIEHAHLYELARENALFAQAMSNVAARLNSVIATGMGMGNEIHHLICTEGANALRADLAILYVYHPNGQFIPHAAIIGDPEPATFPQEWPPIPANDYYTLLHHSTQPTLLQVNLPTHPQADLNGSVQIVSKPAEEDQPTTDSPVAAPHSRAAQAEVRVSRSQSAPLRPTRASLIPINEGLQVGPRRLLTLQEALQRRYVSIALLAPLIIHQTAIGLLVLARAHRPGSREKRTFAQPDLIPARDFAGQASIALTNARLYYQLRTAHRRMQELDQLKDQFMVTASHELRTPLTAVQGYLELLEHYHISLSPEQQQEFLEKASRGCEELVLLLNNVMDASRLEIEAGIRSAHLERVSVREMVESVVDLVLLQATQENRDVRIAIPSQLLVKADPTRLRQVIRNLCANALKYSPPGSPLSFSAHPVFTQDTSVILNVTDRGKGIQPQDQSKLFQRFVRLESDLNSTVRGSGLGLYISRRLIEAMNGKIWIESTGVPGEGTTFSIQLPMA